MNNNETDTWQYESFITLALKQGKEENDKYKTTMLQLIEKEKGSLSVKELRKETLVEAVRQTINASYFEMYKLQPTEPERQKLALTGAQLTSCQTSSDFIKICETGLTFLLRKSSSRV